MQIHISQLRKTFADKTAVDIPDFSIADGEILGLVGNNGAGKTTLFRLMLDLLRPDSGCVVYTCNNQQIDPAHSEAWKNYVGAYIDESFLIDFLTPEEYFDFIAKVNNLKPEETAHVLEHFSPLMNGEVLGSRKLIRDLSAGNKQKVGIIAALLHKPSLLILDEPFNFLDPLGQNVLKKMLTDYHRETQSTILISSHNLAHTIDICPRISILEHGVIVKDLHTDREDAARELENYFNADELLC